MLSLSPNTRRFAAALAALAGYIDAIGYLSLGGFFVSFMSGNSTRLAVGAAENSSDALLALLLIATFIFGVIAGTLIARLATRPRAAVIGSVAISIAIAAGLSIASRHTLAGLVLALAMGMENAAFVSEGGLPVGLTYMTGTLVKIGQQIGSISSRRDVWQWRPYALHWIALMTGAIGGAYAFRTLGSEALWPAAVAAAILAIVA